MREPRSSTAFAKLETRRRTNLRQLLLRMARIVNRDVVEGLRARGYPTLRSTHTTLLANVDLAGTSITVAAQRAGITKQAMGRLAVELQTAGYIAIKNDPNDGRVRMLRFTPSGRRLMLHSFDVMADLERNYASKVGARSFKATLDGLTAIVATLERT
jgi:DNA-binding MarR family transcriptional regulator